MKHYAQRPAQPAVPPLTLPPFHAVPTRPRADGWTPRRQAEFIGWLAQTRSVTAAARRVSMARETAYRLRERRGAQGFAAVWDMALASRSSAAGLERFFAAREAALAAGKPSRKVTLRELEWRYTSGKWRVVLRGGRFVGVLQLADNEALLALLRRTGSFRKHRDGEAA